MVTPPENTAMQWCPNCVRHVPLTMHVHDVSEPNSAASDPTDVVVYVSGLEGRFEMASEYGATGAEIKQGTWTARRVLAVPIWQVCSLIDKVPWWFPSVGWQRHGCLGCYPLRISRLAIKVERDS